MAIDAVWAGVVGTVAGGVVGSATSLLAPLINWRTEEKRLAVEKQTAKELADQQHAHELERLAEVAKADDLSEKRKLIVRWREGLAATMQLFHAPGVVVPPLSGTPWFETLRPHLNTDDIEIKIDFVSPVFAEIDETKAKTLSDEITRIARDWGALS